MANPHNTSISNSTNPAIAAHSAELDQLEAKLKDLVGEIGTTSTHLKSLRQHEASLEFKVTNTQAKLQTLMNNDTKQVTTEITKAVQEEENQMRLLQSQITNLTESRANKLQELGQINTIGHNADNSTAAGAQQKLNVDIARYDLVVPDVATGLSHDPLAQTPSKGRVGPHFERKHEEFASTIDNIGNHVSASPYVRPEDYQIVGERPKTGSSSAKFSEWRSPDRMSTRVAQPPGGFSHMQSIFG